MCVQSQSRIVRGYQRIWCLLEIMQSIQIHLFCQHIRHIANDAQLGTVTDHRQQVLTLQSMAKKLEELGELCIRSELRMTSKSVVLLKQLVELQLTGAAIDFNSLMRAVSMLATRLEDELSLRAFFELEPRQAELFQNPFMHWDAIIDRFEKTRLNVEESSKCFALERYGAAVFHILQVAEYGVIQLSTLMNVQGDRPGWGSLKRLSTILEKPYNRRSDFEQRHSKFLNEAVPLAIIIRDNWRHKLDHVDNQIVWVDTDFSPRVAEEIISATCGFMRKLASELP